MTSPFQRILLATEHTEFDAGAERLGLAMAARCGLPLAALIPLVSNPEYEAIAPQLAARAEAEARGKIAALENAGDAAGVEMEIRVRRGEEIWQEIVAEARDYGADLLVTRRRGRKSFLANLLVGDMVSKVAAHSPANVLLVPRFAHIWRRGIVAAIDASATAERVVAIATGVAAQCGLPLHFVHVAGEAKAHGPALLLAGAVESAKAAGVAAAGEIAAGKVHEAVLAALARAGADLLVVGLRSEDAVERFSLGSHARKIIGLAETPVLIVRPAGP